MTNIAIEERRNWIGSSESAALFGVSPYTSLFTLWHEKIGALDAESLDEVERVQAGQFLEPSIAAWAAHRWEWEIEKVHGYRANPNVVGMGASLDFQLLGGEPLEIKNVDRSEFKKHFIADGDVIIDAPEHFLIQVQHQIACPEQGREPPERGWLVACVGGNRLYRMEVVRHDRMIGLIESKVAAFWQTIESNTPPTPDFHRDAFAIGLLYNGENGEIADLTNNARALELAQQHHAAHEVEKDATKTKDAAMAELKFMLQNARGALIDGGYKITVSQIKASVIKRSAYFRFQLRHSDRSK